MSAAQRTFMQQRIETLHRMTGPLSRWLKPGDGAASAPLAHVDPVSLVTAPPGLEVGYVPIAVWEAPSRPPACHEVAQQSVES